MKTDKPMKLIATHKRYNFWKGTDENGKHYYNVVPTDQQRPSGGYLENPETICAIKNVPNLFKTTK